ncbi:MAG: alginate lyase family protein [Ignavibacteriales bacterium]|nr:alginate lyase family protein [Ignavibacteriales bacterium]
MLKFFIPLFFLIMSYSFCFVVDPGGYSLIDIAHVKSVKKQLAEGDKKYEMNYKKLIKDANKLLKATSLSVMDKEQVAPSGDKHDYMSLAPYWWPDPKNPNGPYIRKDGQRNPEIYEVADHDALSKTMKSIFTLSLAYCYSGDQKYADKAISLVDVWFVAPGTRMNPNLNYAQAVKGRSIGRGSGLIESRHFISLTDALRLLEGNAAYTTEKKAAITAWLSEFFIWLQTSKIGLDEAAADNNHGSWYVAQFSAIGSYIGKHDDVKALLHKTGQRITAQIEPDGRQPLELARTTSFGYSHFNLLALSVIINQALNYGLNFYDFSSPDGRSYKKAVDFLYAYAAKEKEWTFEQIKPIKYDEAIDAYLFAAKFYKDNKYQKLAVQLDKDGLKSCSEVLYINGY